jgi:CheY-like chemotaxis protein
MEPHNPENPMCILLVEDNEHDAVVFKRALKQSQMQHVVTHCFRAEDALAKLNKGDGTFHVVVSGYKLLGMTGMELHVEILKTGIQIPFIILTGAGSEHLAVEALKTGVDDYIVKDSNDAYLQLLPLVLQEAVRRHDDYQARLSAEQEKEGLIWELKNALEKVKTLRGLIPICVECHNIRDDQGYWNRVETYIETHSLAEFSHGICPDCMKTLYPNYYKKKCRIEEREYIGEAEQENLEPR